MLILGLDTTLDTFSVALRQKGRTLCQWTGGQPRQHLTQLFPVLEMTLQVAGVKLRELDGLAVTTGPGSFTGVRLGVSVARTIAMAHDLPLAEVDACQALAAAVAGPVTVCLDARKREVYWQSFLDGQPAGPARLASPAEWRASLPSEAFLIGTALATYGALVADWRLGDADLALVQAARVAQLGQAALEGGLGMRWEALLPRYMRDAEVQLG